MSNNPLTINTVADMYTPKERIRFTPDGGFYVNQRLVICDDRLPGAMQRFHERQGKDSGYEFTHDVNGDPWDTISFWDGDLENEILRIEDDVFSVRGVVTTEPLDIYVAFCEWLRLQGN